MLVILLIKSTHSTSNKLSHGYNECETNAVKIALILSCIVLWFLHAVSQITSLFTLQCLCTVNFCGLLSVANPNHAILHQNQNLN